MNLKGRNFLKLMDYTPDEECPDTSRYRGYYYEKILCVMNPLQTFLRCPFRNCIYHINSL